MEEINYEEEILGENGFELEPFNIPPPMDPPPPIPGSQQEEEPSNEITTVNNDEPTTIVAAGSTLKNSFILRTVASLTRKFAGEEMEGALVDVLELLQKFFSDSGERYSMNEFLFSLLLLAIYYKTPPIRSSVIEDDEAVLRSSAYYFKFAAAAYGWKLMNGLMFDNKEFFLIKGFMTGDQQNVFTLCEHTGIAAEDLIIAKWTSADFHPAHYIAVDHASEAIVFAIRGTFHIKDALTDLIAHSVPFGDGFAHGGMLKAAEKKLGTVKDILLDSMKKYFGYRLVIVGHSLGAGSATLISMLLKNEFPEMNIECYAFAPPCVVDIELAASACKYIKSYVLENDVVPRLSYGSMEFLKDTTIELMSQSQGNTHRILQAAAAGGQLSQGISQKIGGILNYKQEVNTSDLGKSNTLEDKLFPAGRVYHLFKDNDLCTQFKATNKPVFCMEKSNNSFFGEIIVSQTMFSDHMPNAYHRAFEGILHHQALVRFGKISVPEHKQNAIYSTEQFNLGN